MADVTVTGATKRFGPAVAVDAVDLTIGNGEFVALLGPSGCGKTTLLRLIAGFERVDGGTIALNGVVVSSADRHLPPERRRIGMVFQSYALWPHMTVAENVGYPLRIRRLGRADRDRRVAAALEAVGLAHLHARRPAALSGGQRQRVALARCLVMEPAVVLLDEPLANLDVHLRESMQAEFRRFHEATGATMVYVTHDQAEAMALADRIAVMDAGRLAQVAPPRTLYREPATEMVARFVGRGTVVDATALRRIGDGRVVAEVLGTPVFLRAPDGAVDDGPARVCLRAETLALTDDADVGVPCTVIDTTYRGAMTSIEVQPAGHDGLTFSLTTTGTAPEPGAPVRVAIQDGWLLPGTG